MTTPPSVPALENYKLESVLGSGSFGVVYKTTHLPTGNIFATKQVNKQRLRPEQVQRLVFEHKCMNDLVHPNILKCHAFVTSDNDYFLIMEYADCGDLLDYIKRKQMLSEMETILLFRQIVSAVEFTHKNLTIHRDLKCENILLTHDCTNILIADWGLAGVWQPGALQSESFGSIHYASPEICNKVKYTGPEVDIWSLGVVLFAMLTGKLPFYGSSDWKIYQRIRTAEYRIPPHVSPDAQDLIRRILIPDPLRRISMHDVKKHKWLSGSHMVDVLGSSISSVALSSEPDTSTTAVPLAQPAPSNRVNAMPAGHQPPTAVATSSAAAAAAVAPPQGTASPAAGTSASVGATPAGYQASSPTSTAGPSTSASPANATSSDAEPRPPHGGTAMQSSSQTDPARSAAKGSLSGKLSRFQVAFGSRQLKKKWSISSLKIWTPNSKGGTPSTESVQPEGEDDEPIAATPASPSEQRAFRKTRASFDEGSTPFWSRPRPRNSKAPSTEALSHADMLAAAKAADDKTRAASGASAVSAAAAAAGPPTASPAARHNRRRASDARAPVNRPRNTDPRMLAVVEEEEEEEDA